MASASNTLLKILYILQDENNPYGSEVDTVFPQTVFDQVIDNQSATNKTLREVIADLRQEIITGGTGSIVFPVNSVQGRRGDVVLTKEDIGLDHVNNTTDMEKPLSDNQRSSVQIMINNAIAEVEHPRTHSGELVDFDELVEHLTKTDNPHSVTFSQINARGDATNHISSLISNHNNSASAHQDLRESLRNLQQEIASTDTTVNEKIDAFGVIVERHYADPAAHSAIFDTKENVSNKVNNFQPISINHIKYPSTQAVAEFVAAKINELREEIEDDDTSVSDVSVVKTRDDIPEATVNNYREIYFVCHAPNNTTEIAVCRKMNDTTYYWDYSTFTEHATFDPTYFYEGDNGLTIYPATIAELILDDENILNHITNTVTTIVTQQMSNYISKAEYEQMENVKAISILPGSLDGTIRFYINHDQSTMSSDISVRGLKKMAFKDNVEENDIPDNTIQSRHIVNSNITREKIEDKAINTSKMTTGYMTVLGNVDDPNNATVQEIPMATLAEMIQGGTIFIYATPEELVEDVEEAWEAVIPVA